MISFNYLPVNKV